MVIPSAVVCSHCCRWDDLCVPEPVRDREVRDQLILAPGWARHWTAGWNAESTTVVSAVQDLAHVPWDATAPVRAFSWRRGQRHRPGLQFLVSTGRHHGFESVAEQRVLLALDFAGDLSEVWSQPLWLRYSCRSGWRKHVPDFLASTRQGLWLIDVRPAERMDAKARLDFAATAEAALVVGWHYRVVIGFRRQVMTVVDTLSAQRRALTDPCGIGDWLVAQAQQRPYRFGDLVAGTGLTGLARAQLLHLLWWRRLAVDLAAPLGDASLVWHPAHR